MQAFHQTLIQSALTRLGLDQAQILLWTADERLADVVRTMAGTDVVRVSLSGGWQGWVLIRDAVPPRRRCPHDSRARKMIRPSAASPVTRPRSTSRSSRPIVSAITGQTCAGVRCLSMRVARS